MMMSDLWRAGIFNLESICCVACIVVSSCLGKMEFWGCMRDFIVVKRAFWPLGA